MKETYNQHIVSCFSRDLRRREVFTNILSVQPTKITVLITFTFKNDQKNFKIIALKEYSPFFLQNVCKEKLEKK